MLFRRHNKIKEEVEALVYYFIHFRFLEFRSSFNPSSEFPSSNEGGKRSGSIFLISQIHRCSNIEPTVNPFSMFDVKLISG